MNAKTEYPIKSISGVIKKEKDRDGKLWVTRQKKYGGEEVGPVECYPMMPHQGEWSEQCVANRAIYSEALKRMYAEARDEENAKEWIARFKRYRQNPKAEEWANIAPNLPIAKPQASVFRLYDKPIKPKVYANLRGFMLAVIRAEIVSQHDYLQQ